MKPLHEPLEASSDLSSSDVPLKIFEKINEKYLRIGDELFLILDEIENNDHIDEETKLTGQEVENISSTETCIKEYENSSFRIITENVTKDNCKIFLNADDQDFTLKCPADKGGEHYSSFQNLHSNTPSEDIKKTLDDNNFEETTAEVSNNSDEDDEISKECYMSVEENIVDKPELQAATNSFYLLGPEIRGASSADILKSNLNRVSILNVVHNGIQNQGGYLQDEISVVNSDGTSIFTYGCISYQEELVKFLVDEYKDHSRMESVALVHEKDLSSNEIFMEKKSLLSLLKNGRKIKRTINNNLKIVAKNMSALKLKEKKVKKKNGKSVNCRNELRKSLGKATLKSSETSMELIKRYNLKEIKVVLKKLDFNFEQLQNKCSIAKKSARSDLEDSKPAYLNDKDKKGGPSTKIIFLKKSVKNKFPEFKQNEVIKNNETNERSAQLNSSNAHDICNVSLTTETAGESVSQEVHAKFKTDSLSVVVSKMRCFSELQRLMVKNNVKTVNIPENIYGFFKQNSSLTSEKSNLRIICNKDVTTPILSVMKRKTSSEKNDERSEMLGGGNRLDNGPRESFEKPQVTVNSEEFKGGLNSMSNDSSEEHLPLTITGENVISNTSKDRIVSSPEQCNLKSENNKMIKNGFSNNGPLNTPGSTFTGNNNKKFKSNCSHTLTESSPKHSNFYTENKKSKSKFPNLSLQNSQKYATLNTNKNKINRSRSVLKSSEIQINSYIEYFKKIKHLSTTVASETSPKQVVLPAKNGKKFKADLSCNPTESSLKHPSQHNARQFKCGPTNRNLTETLKKKSSSTKNFKLKEILSKSPTENSEKQILSQENKETLKHYLTDLLVKAPENMLSSLTKNYKNLAENSSNAPMESSQKHIPLLLEDKKNSKENLSDTQKEASQISLSLYSKDDKKDKKCGKKLRRLIVSSSLWGGSPSRKRNHKKQGGGSPKRSLQDFHKVAGNYGTKVKESVTVKKNAMKGTVLSHQMSCRLGTDGNCGTSGIETPAYMIHNVSSDLTHKDMNIHHIWDLSKCQEFKSSKVNINSVQEGRNGDQHPDIFQKKEESLVGNVEKFIEPNKKYIRGHPEVFGLIEIKESENGRCQSLSVTAPDEDSTLSESMQNEDQELVLS